MGKRSRAETDADAVEVAADPSEEVEAPVSDPTPEPAPRREPTDEEDDGFDGLPAEGEEGEEGDGRRARVMRFAKRLMDRRELSTDTREILGSVLATSDKAKNEAVRMVAREARSYLDALELKEDFKELITSYSLQITLSLKPLSDAARPRDGGEPPEEGEG